MGCYTLYNTLHRILQNMRKRKLYLAVTPDKYELPLCVEDNPIELARKFNTTKNSMLSQISHGTSGKLQGYKFVRVDYIEDGEE